MTQRERLLVALDGGRPDQVPVTWELVDRCALAFTGRTGWRAMCDAHRMVGSAIFNLQGVGPSVSWDPADGYRQYAAEVGRRDGWTVTEHTIETPRGRLRQETHSGGIPGDPLVHKRVESFVKAPEDWDIYEDYIDAHTNGRYDVTEAAAAREYVGDDGLVNYWIGDSLYALANMRDSAQFVMDLMDMPDRMQALHEKMRRLTALSLEAFNASDADVVVFDIAWASTSLISPALCERFVFPEACAAVESLAPGKRIVFFTSGRIRDVLPMLADAGPHGIQHLDVLGDCDLAEVKRAFGARFCLMGNYNPVALARGSIGQAQAEARRCLEAAMAGGGYIITTSDEVPADAKLGNMRAVVDLVAEEGRY